MSENKTSNVLYMLPNMINFLWYRNMPKPVEDSIVYTPTIEEIETMRKDAEEEWGGAFAKVVSKVANPFSNLIYDRDPID